MKRLLLPVLFLAALTTAGASSASVLFGNPTVTLVLASGSSVEIGSVRAYTCPGNETVAVNGTLTTTNSLSAVLSEDTWCAMDVQVKWSGASSYEVVPVDGFTSFVTDSAEPYRTIVLDPVGETATLQ